MNGFNVQAICFDYYGTLVHIGKPYEQIKELFQRQIEDENSEVSIEKFNTCFSKYRAKLFYGPFMKGKDIMLHSYLYSCNKYGLKPRTEELMELIDRIFSETVEIEGVASILKKLREKYIVTLITNADNDVLYKSIKRHGFSFDYIISSEDAACNKPQREIFDMALKNMGIPANKAIMIGDSITEDIMGAQNVGLKTLWISGEKDHTASVGDRIDRVQEVLKYIY